MIVGDGECWRVSPRILRKMIDVRADKHNDDIASLRVVPVPFSFGS